MTAASSRRSFSGPAFVGRCQLTERAARVERPARPRCFAEFRVFEIEAVIRRRGGSRGLRTDDAGLFLLPAFSHIVLALRFGAWQRADRPPGDILRGWAARWLPGASAEEIDEAAVRAIRKPCRYRPDTLARMLQVTAVEREELGLRTIGAVGQDADARRAMRREKDRQRKASRRAAEREARPPKIEVEKPWVALGMSRRTWYRRGRPKVSSLAQNPVRNIDTGYCTADGSRAIGETFGKTTDLVLSELRAGCDSIPALTLRTGLSPNTTKLALRRLIAQGVVVRLTRGRYAPTQPHHGGRGLTPRTGQSVDTRSTPGQGRGGVSIEGRREARYASGPAKRSGRNHLNSISENVRAFTARIRRDIGAPAGTVARKVQAAVQPASHVEGALNGA